MNFSEIFIFMPMLTALFWAFFIFMAKNKTYPQTILGLFMVLEVVLYLCHSIFFIGDKWFYLKFDALYNFVGLCTYPTYYLYVRLLTVDETVKKQYFKHFIVPIILFLGMLLLHFVMKEEDKIEYLNNTIAKRKMPANSNGKVLAISILFFIGRIAFAFQAVFYLVKSYFLSKKYNKDINNFHSNTKGKSLQWLKNIVIIILITTIVSFTVNIIGRSIFAEHNNSLLFIPSIIFTAIIFTLGYQGYKQTYSIKNFNLDLCGVNNSNKKYANQVMLSKDLKLLIKKESLFLDPNLSICNLSKILNVNRTYISKTINNELNMNFNDFVNKERVLHSKKLMKKNTRKNYSLEAIAVDSGFGSFSSFNRSFKKFENRTPASYKAEISSKK